MQGKKKYWKGLEELYKTPEFESYKHKEFPEYLPVNESAGDKGSEEKAPRRDFLKLLGFGMAAVSLASCEAPVRKAIPYLNKPEDLEPGVPNWYASTYFTGSDYNAVLVKTREGRPIKLEGNPMSSITNGGLSARAQASLLSLYDNNRLQGPIAKGKETTWDKVDSEVTAALNGASGKVVLLSQTIISPSTKQVIRDFGGKFGSFEHVTLDPVSASGLLAANNGVVPGYDFSKAKVIVSVGADFLGSWISPVEYATQYIKNRKVSKANPVMSRHYQFEPYFSITGANADIRAAIKPSDEARVVAALYNAITQGGAGVSGGEGFPVKQIEKAAKDLQANRGAALVVSGSNDENVQALVKAINEALGADGTTINSNAPSYLRQGNDAAVMRVLQEMENGSVGAVIFYNSNPVFTHPLSSRFKAALSKVGTKISFADRIDETAALCDYVCPDHNFLESWNDFEPKRGYVSFSQPAISPIFKTRYAQESLLAWSGNKTTYYDFMRNNWRKYATGDFNNFWEKAIHDGVVENTSSTGMNEPANVSAGVSASAAASAIAGMAKSNGLEVSLYESVNLGSGEFANNPWLLELPDPISKASWGNYVAVSQTMAKEQGIEQGDIVKVTVKGSSLELPVLVQPGQHRNAISIAIGFGREKAGPAANNLGANAYPLATVSNDGKVLFFGNATLEKTGARSEIAQTQTHHTIMGRNIVQEAPLSQYQQDPTSVTEYIKIATADGPKKPAAVSLWKDYEYKDHHWGMVIDLNSCIGCGSCVMACQVENNIPVVGKQEIINRREMHWLRIDRYYSSDATREDGGFTEMENPSDNPSVVFQPMLCQHCNHAPCETVCPVAATMHSSEGLNQMAYNRCVGTRYCANNCPYKVRRFNWFAYANNDKFDFNMNNDLGKMALNPDVVVRSRGVMEKCSFCVQRIQAGKLQAKKDKRRPVDGEIQTACSQSCPTNAIVFGDMLDGESRVSQLLQQEKGERAYHVLEELNVQPNITYLTQIRNLA